MAGLVAQLHRCVSLENLWIERDCIGNRAGVCIPITRPGDMTLTTQVAIVPDYLPFQCTGSGCTGTLL